MTVDWRALPHEGKSELRDRLALALADRRRAKWEPYPWQTAPATPATLGIWLMLGGRGTGKTDGCARYMDDHVRGPACSSRVPGGHRMSIIAPTLGDAAESCFAEPSGLLAHNPSVRMLTRKGGSYVVWPNGAEAKLFGAHTPEDVERLRAGGNRCLIWLEELAAMRHLGIVLEQSKFGLRLGHHPHFIGSTTPKSRPELVKLLTDPRTIITRGKTDEAHHLDPSVRDELYSKYKGTRLGRQELDGELLTDVEGALWKSLMIELERIKPPAPQMTRVVVSVDPAATNTSESDETGIIVVGCGPSGPEQRGYVLADRSGRYSPGEWARKAVTAYHEYEADAIVAEVNNGGDMVGFAVHTIDASVRYRTVNATRGKQLRAEPVVALYEQRRISHVGTFPELEDQMTTWVPGSGADSPDRLDAAVHGLTDLLLRRKSGHASVS